MDLIVATTFRVVYLSHKAAPHSPCRVVDRGPEVKEPGAETLAVSAGPAPPPQPVWVQPRTLAQAVEGCRTMLANADGEEELEPCVDRTIRILDAVLYMSCKGAWGVELSDLTKLE